MTDVSGSGLDVQNICLKKPAIRKLLYPGIDRGQVDAQEPMKVYVMRIQWVNKGLIDLGQACFHNDGPD